MDGGLREASGLRQGRECRPACLPPSLPGWGEIPGEKPRLRGDVTVLLEPTTGSAPGFIGTAGQLETQGPPACCLTWSCLVSRAGGLWNLLLERKTPRGEGGSSRVRSSEIS